MAGKSSLMGNLACATAYVIFGLNIVFCKDIANAHVVSPIALFTLRALGASSLFWLISMFMPQEKVDRKDLPKIAAASFLGLFLTQITFLKAITMSTSLDTSIISTLSPIFTMLTAAVVLKEPITFKKAGGVAISFAGVLFLIFNSITVNRGADHTSPLGIFLLLCNAASFALYLGIFRPLIAKYSVVTFMKWMFLFSLLMSLPFSFQSLIAINVSAISTQVMLEIGFLIFFATFVAYFLIPYGQKRVRPTIVSMYSYVQPVLAAVISICIGMDVLTWQKVVATIFVFGGVVIVNRSRAAGQPR